MIRIRRLSKEYPGGTRALDDVSLDIVDGEFVALIGPSGAGKSSLLRCVNGLVAPSSGEVIVDGQAVTGAPDEAVRQVRADVGFVFQQFNLLRRLTVLQNVLVGRLAHASRWRSLIGWFDAVDVARARAVLERIGLDGLADRRVEYVHQTMQFHPEWVVDKIAPRPISSSRRTTIVWSRPRNHASCTLARASRRSSLS